MQNYSTEILDVVYSWTSLRQVQNRKANLNKQVTTTNNSVIILTWIFQPRYLRDILSSGYHRVLLRYVFLLRNLQPFAIRVDNSSTCDNVFSCVRVGTQ